MSRKRERPSDLLLLSLLLGLAALGCALLYGVRVIISRRPYYFYLIVNLLLAFVPYLVAASASVFLKRPATTRGRAWLALPFSLLWLLFFPNSPYIFTDFIHVVNRIYLRSPPAEWLGLNAFLWYDLAMTAAFAFVGHFVGLVSLWLMHGSLRDAWGKAAARALVLFAILLSGFGIYLGRFSRLNSWDVVAAPGRVATEFLEAAADPKALFFSLVFALFVGLSYGSLVAFKRLGRD